MSEPASPRTPHTHFSALEEAARQLQDRTPTYYHNVPDNSSKENCEFLMFQGWGARTRRLWNRSGESEFENCHTGESTEKEYWDKEVGFQEGLKEETERSSFKWDDPEDDPEPAPSTHISPVPLAPRSTNRPSPHSRVVFKRVSKGISYAGVQKKARRPKGNGWTKRKQRSAKKPEQQEPEQRESEQQEPLAPVREEEPGLAASLESASGRVPTTMTLSEGTRLLYASLYASLT
ncbi:hypothetical protein B0T17DRAFT_619381 [Bombardia bombarda]|uniref:Uncharacterized protein n=1 Tax=Bombardia bombarda TaxID=252184 RepID=A0AA39WI21_9PEZI|nr:hypothetical protein B0T17DRAFT_619381 [Bombardia bombarda]